MLIFQTFSKIGFSLKISGKHLDNLGKSEEKTNFKRIVKENKSRKN